MVLMTELGLVRKKDHPEISGRGQAIEETPGRRDDSTYLFRCYRSKTNMALGVLLEPTDSKKSQPDEGRSQDEEEMEEED